MALSFVPPRLTLDPDVLVGNETHDDAGIYRLTADQALVQTVDFLTPVVDDPELFGKVAAANSLSDVYAMGGVPVTALNLLAVPEGVLSPQEVGAMLQGGQSILDQASCRLLGGHSIDDIEPKMGYAVTGLVHPDHIWRNSTAQVGNLLYLSKPIGSGVVIKAVKDGEASQEMTESVIAMMTTLNHAASEAIKTVGDPTACTDVTGFGLLGHSWEMAEGAGVAITIEASRVPVLPGARELADQGRFPSGSRRNLDYVRPHLDAEPKIGVNTLTLLADAVTSGGLLFTVKQENAAPLEAAFRQSKIPLYWIGWVEEGPPLVRVLA